MRIYSVARTVKLDVKPTMGKKNLKILLLNALVQNELCNDKAEKMWQGYLKFFWLHLRVSSAAEQRKVTFSAWPARLPCNCLQGPANAPTPPKAMGV